jgi:dihydrodipicolinate synthase/N-acetylneuraminate lyase
MPRTGLNIPIVTAFDDAGNIIESDQRRIIRHTIYQGRGANSLFICGTTGEFNRITNKQRQRLLEIGVEETKSINSLLPENIEPVEAWVGVTAGTKAETLENLELAAQLKADIAVIAPLAISDLAYDEIIEFFKREVAKLVSGEPLPIALYENPDIAAASQSMSLLPLSCIDELRRLPFVTCLKASTTREVMQDYIRAFYSYEKAEEFPLYFGNAGLIFEMDDLKREAGVSLQKAAVAGVVSGTANLFPREWRQAWHSVIYDEKEKSAAYRDAFEAFEKLTVFSNGQGSVSKLIAGIKQAMYSEGIISSPSVARGTPALTTDEAKQLTEGLAQVLSVLRTKVNPQNFSAGEARRHEASVTK